MPQDLTNLSLESLLNIEVTSVSKREEKQSAAAAAIYVLTGDEIRRSGAHNLPEALRLVPGLTVARVDSHTWVVTARGFSSTLADKLEVLMDGRSLYTPLFSGVFWDVQDTFLEDIDRIEVIRGPGAALWGANAVNGVINIVTKSAGQTQGAVVDAGGGGEFRGYGGARYGGKIGESGNFRVYAKTTQNNNEELVSGTSAHDAWRMSQGGFRADWAAWGQDNFTFQGDAYDGALDTIGNDTTVSGANVIGRWTRTQSADSGMSLQWYVDETKRDVPGVFNETRDTFDLDFQHSFPWRARNEIVWGGGYRISADRITNSPSLSFHPTHRSTDIFSLFAQDQIAITPDRLTATLGTKLENNTFTGLEVQPSVRLAYTPDRSHTVWAAVSRAVRIPNRLDNDVQLQAPTVPTGFIVGNENFESETVIAYELGYRMQPRENMWLDIATYYNDYDRLRGINQAASPNPKVSNEGSGKGYGVETDLVWQLTERWRLQGGYDFQHLDLRKKSGSSDNTIEQENHNDPRHQVFLRSSLSLPYNWNVDGTVRHVSELSAQNVPAYTELDLRAAWRASERAEFALVGRNLLNPRHLEFGSTPSVEIKRSLYGTVTWRFQ